MTEQTEPAAKVKRTDAENIDTMCQLILSGSTLDQAIKATFGCRWTYTNLISKEPALGYKVLMAQGSAVDFLVDECVEIADNEPDANRARNMISSRQWIAAKRKPKVYGERLEMALQHSIDITQTLADARGRVTGMPAIDVEIVDVPVIETSVPAPELDIFS